MKEKYSILVTWDKT